MSASLYLEGGVRLMQVLSHQDNMLIRGYASVAYSDDVLNSDATVLTGFTTGTTTVITPIERINDGAAIVEAGIVAISNGALEAQIGYSGVFGSDQEQHTGTARLRAKF